MPACDKNEADGGCAGKRCNKDLEGLAENVCEKDTPCDLEQCQAKCASHWGFRCTHVSWEAKDQDCYLFGSCASVDDKEDYDTYSMRPACEKTKEDGGCPNKRCPKAFSAKVCAAKESTGCDLATCEANCAEYTAFVCTHFSFEESDGDCYVFSACSSVNDKDGYSTYAVRPGCEAGISAGGCQKKRCPKSGGKKVCAAKDSTACDLPTCKSKCDTQTDFECTHIAFDENKGDCYVFVKCPSVDDNDDYTTYAIKPHPPAVSATCFGGAECRPRGACLKGPSEGGCAGIVCDSKLSISSSFSGNMEECTAASCVNLEQLL